MARQPYYITVQPLPSSQAPDLASLREWICADVLARHQRDLGHDVRLVAGSIEQGRDAERAAFERGATVEDHTKEAAKRYEATLAAFDVQCDALVRTSEARHQHLAKAIFLKLFDQGDIYKTSIKSHLCSHCKEYVATPAGERDPFCPDCGRATAEAKEECFFLRSSAHHKALLDHMASHPEFIVPASRADALLAKADGEGARDLRISCPATEWAIPVPINPRHAIAPAFNALITYLTGSGYLADPQVFERYWPPKVQSIPAWALEDHLLAWPALLVALGLPLPERLLVQGGLQWGSAAPKAATGDLMAVAARTGADVMRLATLGLGPCTADGALDYKELLPADGRRLTQDLGTLLTTTITGIATRRDGLIPRPGALREPENALVEAASGLRRSTGAAIEGLEFGEALDQVQAVVAMAAQYAEKRGVLGLAEADAEPRRLDTVLYVLAEVCRLVANSLRPLLPGWAARMEKCLGVAYGGQAPNTRHRWGLTQPNAVVQAVECVFPHVTPPVE